MTTKPKRGIPLQKSKRAFHTKMRGLAALALSGICLLSVTSSSTQSVASSQTSPALKLTRVSTASQARRQRPARISITFTKTDIRDVLASIADYAGVDVLVTPGASGAITLNLRQRTADEAIRLAAAAAGMTVARIGGSYLVGSADEVRKAAAEFGQREIVPLRYISPATAKEVLSRVVPNVGVEAAGTSVMVTGLPENISVARQAISQIDVLPPAAVPERPQTSTVNLKFADPAGAEKLLKEAFPGIRITRQERTLVLSAVSAELQAAERAIQQLDVEPTPIVEAPQAVVYQLKYLNAKRAEESLKKALPSVSVTAAPEPNAPPPASFQPLSLSFLGGGAGGNSGGTGGGGGFGSGQAAGGGQQGGGAGQGIGGSELQPLARSTRLVLIGQRSDINLALQILEETDKPQPIARIEASLIELNMDDVKDLGLRWDPPFGSGLHGGQVRVQTGRDLRFGGIVRGPSTFTATIQALMTKDKARVLASPNISVVDNEDANIFIGDLIRFRGIQVVSPNVGTVQGTETIPVGIALLVRPRIHPNREVTLKVHPVVSTISSFVDGLPQTASREADTTVRLREGEELIIGGLDRTELISQLTKIPLIGDLPIIGQFFQSRHTERKRTEIVVVIRVYGVETDPAPVNTFRKVPDIK